MIFGILDIVFSTLYLKWPIFVDKLNTLYGEFETELRASESLGSLHDNPSSPIVLFLYVSKIHIIKIANYPRKKLAVTSYFPIILTRRFSPNLHDTPARFY